MHATDALAPLRLLYGAAAADAGPRCGCCWPPVRLPLAPGAAAAGPPLRLLLAPAAAFTGPRRGCRWPPLYSRRNTCLLLAGCTDGGDSWPTPRQHQVDHFADHADEEAEESAHNPEVFEAADPDLGGHFAEKGVQLGEGGGVLLLHHRGFEFL